MTTSRPPGTRDTLGRRLRRLVIVLIVLLVLVAAVSIAALVAATGDLSRLTKGYGPAANANDAALVEIVDAETGIRGYLLTRQDSFLQPYRQGAPKVVPSLDQARAALASVGVHSLDAKIAAERSLAQRWLTTIAEPIAAGRPAGIATQAEGKGLLDRFRAVNAEVAATLTANRDSLRSEAVNRSTIALIVIIAASAAALLFGLAFGLRTARRLARPLAGLAAAASRWKAGELSARADERDGPVEVRAVAQALNEGIAITETAARLRREADTLRKRVRPVTAALRIGADPRSMSQALVIGLGAAYGVDRAWLRTFDDNRVPNLALQWSAASVPRAADFGGPEDADLRALANQIWHGDGILAIDDHRTYRAAGAALPVLATPRFRDAASSLIVAIGDGGSAMGLLVLSHCRAPHAWTETETGLTLRAGSELAQSLVQGTVLVRQQEVIAQLRALDETKSALVSTVSHELRTPLTSISGYLEMVLEGEGGPLPAEADDMLRAVERNTTRLRSLIEDLLTESRIEAGRMQATLTKVAIHEALREVVTTLTPIAEAEGVKLRLRSDGDDSLVVDGDLRQLEQAVTNLVANAVKFTPSGGAVDLAACRYSAQDGRAEVAIEITDTGIGIPEDELPQLFDRFFRASNATRAEIPGTGLGLSIVREIVSAHQGELDVRSSVGVGTTFTIRLPLSG